MRFGSVAPVGFAEFPRSLQTPGSSVRNVPLEQLYARASLRMPDRSTPPGRGRFTLPEDLQTTWDHMREEMRSEVTDFIFHVWLEPLKPAGRVGDKLFITAPGHVRGWVRERYGDLLRRAAARVNGARLEIDLVDEDWEPPAAVKAEPAPQSS